jgi:two-component system response regulator GlrR
VLACRYRKNEDSVSLGDRVADMGEHQGSIIDGGIADVLVVDDHLDLLELIRIVLEREGYRVEATLDAESALAAIERARPGLVLSDIYMPGMDGLALAESLRQRPDPVPVMLMSADRFSLPDDIPFIPKPFDLNELVAIVTSALDRA